MSNRRWVSWLPKPLSSRLSGRISLQSILANSGWLIFDRVVRLSLSLLIGAWIARYLGPAQYGELAYALAYIALFQAITSLGMDGIIVRDLASEQKNSGQILGTVFSLRLLTGTLCWLIAVNSAAWSYGWGDRNVWIIALAGGSLVFQAADTIDLWFQSQSQSRRTVVAKLSTYILSNCVKVSLVFYKAPLIAFAAVMTLDAFAAAIGMAWIYRSFPCQNTWRIVIAQARQLLKESWPFMLSGLSIMIYMRIDQIMIKNMLGEKELGIYAVMIPLSTLWHIIPMALIPSLAPIIARKKLESEFEYYRIFSKTFRLLLAAGIAISLATQIYADVLIKIVYGATYLKAASILKIHIFSNIAVFLGVAQTLWLTNEKRADISLKKTVIGGLVSIVLNLILIPILGLIGAAIAAVVSYFTAAVFSNIFFAKKIFFLQLGIAVRHKDGK